MYRTCLHQVIYRFCSIYVQLVFETLAVIHFEHQTSSSNLWPTIKYSQPLPSQFFIHIHPPIRRYIGLTYVAEKASLNKLRIRGTVYIGLIRGILFRKQLFCDIFMFLISFCSLYHPVWLLFSLTYSILPFCW